MRGICQSTTLYTKLCILLNTSKAFPHTPMLSENGFESGVVSNMTSYGLNLHHHSNPILSAIIHMYLIFRLIFYHVQYFCLVTS